jgi:hypothetical protein
MIKQKRGHKKEENRSSLLDARRYLAFVLTKAKVVFKNYTPNQVMIPSAKFGRSHRQEPSGSYCKSGN